MAIGYGNILASTLGNAPPSANPVNPPGWPVSQPPAQPPTPAPPGPWGGGGHGPHWLGPALRPGQGQIPDWLQARIDAFNSLHNQAVANRPYTVPPTGTGPGGNPIWGGPGWGGTVINGPGGHLTTPGNWQSQFPPAGGGGNAGGGTPPTGTTPPNWQDYWAQWYRTRQPYADWLSGYVRGGY